MLLEFSIIPLGVDTPQQRTHASPRLILLRRCGAGVQSDE